MGALGPFGAPAHAAAPAIAASPAITTGRIGPRRIGSPILRNAEPARNFSPRQCVGLSPVPEPEMDPDIQMFAQVMTIIMASIASLAVIVVGTRIAWRWSSRSKPSHTLESPAHDDRLHRLETAVDAIAIEVERISEAQRFMVGLLGESAQARKADRAELPLPNRAPGRTNTPH